MKWLLASRIVLVVIVVVDPRRRLVAAGEHTRSRRATFAAPPETVWKVITDVDAFPSWRSDVKTVDASPAIATARRLDRSTGSNGRSRSPSSASEPPRRLVDAHRRSDAAVRRHLDLRAGTRSRRHARSTITENGEIYNPIFRVMARFVFGYEATLASYLDGARGRRLRVMGYDAACTLTVDGKKSRGTAWLEHKDLLFRGPTRLAIPLASISSATARDGTLHVTFGERRAAFAIGEAAEKWAKRITNPPSRLDKLGIKPGMTVAILGVDDASLRE